MELREIASAGEAADYVRVHAAVDAADAPWSQPYTTYRLEMDRKHGWDGEPGRWFVGYHEGEAVGSVVINTSERDNLELAWLNLEVGPERRRRGHGTAILERAVAIARGMGRPLIGLDGYDTGSTTGFAESNGFDFKQHSVVRIQHLAGLAPQPADAPDAPEDYELIRIDGHSPEPLLDELAELTNVINDAPTDDLEFEDEVFDAKRVRAYETAQLEGGHRLHRLLARHRATGALAGHTVVAVDAELPAFGEQHDTAVARAHRGHGLGFVLKAQMVEWLREAEPALERIITYNAQSNDHMVDINERLGYRVAARVSSFQRRY